VLSLIGSRLISICRGVPSLLRKQKGERRGQARWLDKGPTPLGERGYAPQGLTWANGRLIFANTWRNTRSRVYEFAPTTMQVLRQFDMPLPAVHTSGLAWDGKLLWAVDYIANLGYCLDLEPSLAGGTACVVGQFETLMQGTSACSIVPWNGEACLAISDFMNSRRTVFVRMQEAIASGSVRGHVVFEYRNEGFSQGLEYAEGCLYESENKVGLDVVNKICLARLAETRDARRATVKQYPAPSKGVEDLAWDGEAFWTSDETVFRFFRGRLEP
jgi:glutamine cyclotransferase